MSGHSMAQSNWHINHYIYKTEGIDQLYWYQLTCGIKDIIQKSTLKMHQGFGVLCDMILFVLCTPVTSTQWYVYVYVCVCVCVCACVCLVAQLYLTLCDPMVCSLPGSSKHEIFQSRILEWVAISLSRESSQFRDWTWVSCVSRIAGIFSTHWAIREAL